MDEKLKKHPFGSCCSRAGGSKLILFFILLLFSKINYSISYMYFFVFSFASTCLEVKWFQNLKSPRGVPYRAVHSCWYLIGHFYLQPIFQYNISNSPHPLHFHPFLSQISSKVKNNKLVTKIGTKISKYQKYSSRDASKRRFSDQIFSSHLPH